MDFEPVFKKRRKSEVSDTGDRRWKLVLEELHSVQGYGCHCLSNAGKRRSELYFREQDDHVHLECRGRGSRGNCDLELGKKSEISRIELFFEEDKVKVRVTRRSERIHAEVSFAKSWGTRQPVRDNGLHDDQGSGRGFKVRHESWDPAVERIDRPAGSGQVGVSSPPGTGGSGLVFLVEVLR